MRDGRVMHVSLPCGMALCPRGAWQVWRGIVCLRCDVCVCVRARCDVCACMRPQDVGEIIQSMNTLGRFCMPQREHLYLRSLCGGLWCAFSLYVCRVRELLSVSNSGTASNTPSRFQAQKRLRAFQALLLSITVSSSPTLAPSRGAARPPSKSTRSRERPRPCEWSCP